jgi:hypothetical protein
MQGFNTNSRRHLLTVLFYLFEAMLVASLVVLCCVDPRNWMVNGGIEDAAGIAFFYSFVGQLVVCFHLRRIE